MTLIISMILNPEYVMGAGDEQETFHDSYGGYRSANTAQKIYPLGNQHFIGQAGSSIFSYEVMRRAKPKIKDEQSTKERADIISDEIYTIRDEERQRCIGDDFKVDIEELSRADSDIAPDIIKKIEKEIDKLNNKMGTQFLVSGIDPSTGEATIYYVPFFGNPQPKIRYDAMGTGEYAAKRVIDDYLEGLTPQQRDDIEPSVGCSVMMRAIRDAWKNEGVGGATQVVWVKKGEEIKTLGHEESNFLQNAIYLQKDLGDDYVSGLFRDVVEQGATIKDLKKSISGKMGKGQLIRILSEGLIS